MTTYNTGNPVGSTDARDLYDNSQTLDQLVNGSGTYSNRLGVQRRTLAQLEAYFDAQLADAESDLNVYRADAAASASQALGYLNVIRTTSYGAYAEDPATDPLGNPPTVGDEYFNTTANLLRRWNGTIWQASDINTANLAKPTGSFLIGHEPAVTGAIATTVKEKLDEYVSTFNFMTDAQKSDAKTGSPTIGMSAAVQSAITYAQNSGAPLEFAGRRYLFEGLVTIDPKKPLTIVGDGVWIDAFGTPFAVAQQDSDAVASTTITGGISLGSNVVAVANSAGIAAGQLAYISSTENMEETSYTVPKQYIALVDSVSGMNVTLSQGAPLPFTAAGNTISIKTFTVAPIDINGLNFNVNGTTGEGSCCVYTKYAANVTIESPKLRERTGASQINPAFDGSARLLSGIQAARSHSVVAKNVDLQNILYGINAAEGSFGCGIEGGEVRRGRHTNNFSSGAYGSFVNDVKALSCYAGFDSHQGAISSRFTNVESRGSVIPSKFRGRSDELVNCRLYDGYEATTDASVLTAYPADSDVGKWLKKSFTDCILRGNNASEPRTRVHTHHLIYKGGHAHNVAHFYVGDIAYIDVCGAIRWTMDQAGKAIAANPFYSASKRLTITDVLALGPDAGVVATDARTTSRILINVTLADSKIVLKNVVGDGWRTALYLSVSGAQEGITAQDCDFINNGSAIRGIGGIDTILGAFDRIRLSGNFVDIENSGRVLSQSTLFTNRTNNGSSTCDPGSLPDGSGETVTVSVPGAVTGDFAVASFSQPLQGVMITAWVSNAGVVSVRFQNETGATVDLASGTLRVRVLKV